MCFFFLGNILWTWMMTGGTPMDWNFIIFHSSHWYLLSRGDGWESRFKLYINLFPCMNMPIWEIMSTKHCPAFQATSYVWMFDIKLHCFAVNKFAIRKDIWVCHQMGLSPNGFTWSSYSPLPIATAPQFESNRTKFMFMFNERWYPITFSNEWIRRLFLKIYENIRKCHISIMIPIARELLASCSLAARLCGEELQSSAQGFCQTLPPDTGAARMLTCWYLLSRFWSFWGIGRRWLDQIRIQKNPSGGSTSLVFCSPLVPDSHGDEPPCWGSNGRKFFFRWWEQSPGAPIGICWGAEVAEASLEDLKDCSIDPRQT